MKISKIFIGSIFTFAVFFSGCGGGGGGSSFFSKVSNIFVSGAVNDGPIPFAKVKLVVNSTQKVLATLTADANGKWKYKIDKASIPANSFIIIYAINPDNDSVIRSVIDTDEVLESEGTFESDETTVSHYTEAAIAMAETDTGINQIEFDKLKALIKLENGEPVPTGNTALDELAIVVQTNYDDVNSSQDELSLSVYKKLLEEKISKVLPDEFGKVSINLPVAYNDEISIDVNISTGTNAVIINNTITFDLTPNEMQSDVNLTVTASLNNESISKIITLYAKGNNKNHYIYKAVAPSSDIDANQFTKMINGRWYTFVPYSHTLVQEENANIASIDVNGSVRSRSSVTLEVADNYQSSKILVRVYEGKEIFDTTTQVAQSNIILLASTQESFGNLKVTRVDDFKPIQPLDTNIELPPVAVEF